MQFRLRSGIGDDREGPQAIETLRGWQSRAKDSVPATCLRGCGLFQANVIGLGLCCRSHWSWYLWVSQEIWALDSIGWMRWFVANFATAEDVKRTDAAPDLFALACHLQAFS